MVLLMARSFLMAGVSVAAPVFLALFGAIGTHISGAIVAETTLRVTFWDALAMALTADIG
jgi:VIT1/CCC1 family predicted Fe2+/Mn2+ transporter